MKTGVLSNGLRVVHEFRDSDVVSVEVSVLVGSNDEPMNLLGVSHFLEHVVLEGSKKRPSASEVANAVERLGGEVNAATSNERTSFYVKLPVKHVEVAFDVLSDVLLNPLFDEAVFEKERKVVLEEINLVNDEPRFFQWVFFQQSLFEKHPAKHAVYGSKETVSSMSLKDMVAYYKKFYVPGNMIVSVVGRVKDPLSFVEKFFGKAKKANVPVRDVFAEPVQTSVKFCSKKRDVVQSYVVMGYKTVGRRENDAFVLDVIRGILGRGQSGRLFDEVRNKRGLAYEVGVHHECVVGYGFFSVYFNTAKKNVDVVRKIVLDEFAKLKELSESDLEDSKNFIEGEFLVGAEDSQRAADLLAFLTVIDSSLNVGDYVSRIRKVTLSDVKRVVDKFLNNNFTQIGIG